MKHVLIFRHLACEGPGYFADFLDQHHIAHSLICVDQGEAVPASLNGVAGLVFMGGPMSVNDDLPWIAQELALIRQAQQSGLPILGHCLGGQLIAKALGAEITRNRVKEIGWHTVECAASVQARDWLDGIQPQFDAFHWHGETFALPVGATPLLSSRWCENQAFAIGNSLALQCHVEMKPEMVQEWCGVHAAEIAESSASLQSAAEMITHLNQRCTSLHRAADVLYSRWIKGL